MFGGYNADWGTEFSGVRQGIVMEEVEVPQVLDGGMGESSNLQLLEVSVRHFWCRNANCFEVTHGILYRLEIDQWHFTQISYHLR